MPALSRLSVPAALLVGMALAAEPAHAGDAANGKRVFEANCTACHGAAGDGRGAAAIALNPKPTDFTKGLSKSDAELIASIKGGRPGTAMTPFTALTDAELADVVSYVRTFAR